MKVLSWQNKNKKSSASQVNTDLQNASRNIDPPDTSIGPGGGKIKQKYNLNASHQPRSSWMPSLYLLLIQKLGMNTCKKTNRTTKQLQHIVNSPCKEKKKDKSPALQPYFCLATKWPLRHFLCSEVTTFKAEPRTKAGLLLLWLLVLKIRFSLAPSVARLQTYACNCTTRTEPFLGSL